MGISQEYEHLPIILCAVLLVWGIYKIFIETDVEIRVGRFVKKLSGDEYAENTLKQAGIKLSAKAYYGIIYGLAGFFILLSIFKGIVNQNLGVVFAGLILAVVILFVFRPAEYLYGTMKSPFKTITSVLGKSRAQKMDREIYSSCIVLKNLAIVQAEKPLSADAMIEILADSSKSLKALYLDLLSGYRTGNTKAAFKAFADQIGTTTARSFVGLLSKLDKINPVELLNQTESLLEAMSQKRLTDGYKRAQRNGIITMTLSTLMIMAVLGDFLVIVIYLDMVSGLNIVF